MIVRSFHVQIKCRLKVVCSFFFLNLLRIYTFEEECKREITEGFNCQSRIEVLRDVACAVCSIGRAQRIYGHTQWKAALIKFARTRTALDPPANLPMLNKCEKVCM